MKISKFNYYDCNNEVKVQIVPEFITKGGHTKFIRPIAQQVCNGIGLDIGCNRIDWKLYPSDVECIGIDVNKVIIDAEYEWPVDAMNVECVMEYFDKYSDESVDYIYSSHCLEHLYNYVEAFEYWTSKLETNGVLFLYLPHPKCKYWNAHLMPTQKHIHTLEPEYMKELFYKNKFKNVFCSEMDMAYSYCIFGEKK